MGVFDPDRHENILGITDIDELNVMEALGIIRAEEFILDLELDVVFDVKLVLDIHTIAFGHLYEWAGKWRTLALTKRKFPTLWWSIVIRSTIIKIILTTKTI